MPTTAAIDPSVPPMPYVVASWLGYPLQHIVDGLRRGTIAPPEGAPPGWLPPGGEAFAPPEDGATDPGDDASTGGDPPLAEDDAGEPNEASDPSEAPGDLRAAYFDLAHAVDASLDDAVFDELWQSSGDDDAARASSVGGLLRRAVGGAADGGDAGALAATIADRGTRGTLVALADEGSSALARRARSDPSVLYALASLDRFAFADVEGGASPPLTRFDATTGEANLSDAWIDDRAKYLAWRDALRDDAEAGMGIGADWRFVDRALGDAATLTLGTGSDEANQVVFARDDGDSVSGGASVDRLHGGLGDDSLEGGGGDDLVEGARGDDALAGGEGNDRVDGGAGDDVLDGGQGNDRLDGGSGHDRYAFARGDGDDVIADADGDGEIVVDGAVLTGSEGDVGYSIESDGTGGTTLVVRAGAPDDATAGEIRVRDWRDGALGIHLPAATDAGEAAPATATEASGAVLKPRIDATASGFEPAPTGDAAVAWARETGNESGMGTIAGAMPAFRASTAFAGRIEDRGGALDAADWSRALRSTPGFAPARGIDAPPAFDAGAVTAADVAGALADVAGEHVDADAAFEATRLPWWTAHEAAPGFEPPAVPPRHGG